MHFAFQKSTYFTISLLSTERQYERLNFSTDTRQRRELEGNVEFSLFQFSTPPARPLTPGAPYLLEDPDGGDAVYVVWTEAEEDGVQYYQLQAMVRAGGGEIELQLRVVSCLYRTRSPNK